MLFWWSGQSQFLVESISLPPLYLFPPILIYNFSHCVDLPHSLFRLKNSGFDRWTH
jgi:hypothetical protein